VTAVEDLGAALGRRGKASTVRRGAGWGLSTAGSFTANFQGNFEERDEASTEEEELGEPPSGDNSAVKIFKRMLGEIGLTSEQLKALHAIVKEVGDETSTKELGKPQAREVGEGLQAALEERKLSPEMKATIKKHIAAEVKRLAANLVCKPRAKRKAKAKGKRKALGFDWTQCKSEVRSFTSFPLNPCECKSEVCAPFLFSRPESFPTTSRCCYAAPFLFPLTHTHCPCCCECRRVVTKTAPSAPTSRVGRYRATKSPILVGAVKVCYPRLALTTNSSERGATGSGGMKIMGHACLSPIRPRTSARLS
jgi:hypothetical protein